MNIHEKIVNRQNYNYKCLDIIEYFVDKFPEWRFGQILWNLGLCVDKFHDESVDIYEDLKKEKKRYAIDDDN